MALSDVWSMKFLGRLTKTGLDFGTPYNEARWRQFCKDHEGKLVKVELPKAIRSLPQNAWFHGVIVPMIAHEIGEDDLGYVKAILKAKFLSKEAVLAGKDGKWDKATVTGRTSRLTKVQFGEFCERCRRWASEFLGLDIPDPQSEIIPFLLDED